MVLLHYDRMVAASVFACLIIAANFGAGLVSVYAWDKARLGIMSVMVLPQ